MRSSPSLKPDQWAHRHRLQHVTGKPVESNVSKRFAREFEAALRQRGAAAKQGA